MSRIDDLQVRQVDQALSEFAPLGTAEIPDAGWLRVVRDALGMSIRQLGERTGLSKTAVASAEASEAKGTVQLDTLRRIANGLECDLVYTLAPRASLQSILHQQARKKAARMVGSVSDSMDLEGQRVGDSEHDRMVEELTAELLEKRRRDFWDD